MDNGGSDSPPLTSRQAVTVSFEDLHESKVALNTLEEAFGSSSLGILIVKDLPAKFVELRQRLLSYASYLANLPLEQLDGLTSPSSNYSTGWSHGKESLKNGQYDTMKGSYYVNCAFYSGKDFSRQSHPLSDQFPESTAPNLWPPEESLPQFRTTFEELCTVIIDTAVLVARACDRYAKANLEDYEPGYLEHVVKRSVITKARLLHYFPPEPASYVDEAHVTGAGLLNKDDEDHDSWCATHIDHGCLTGLTSAMYIDEASHPPYLPSAASLNAPPPSLPPFPGPLSPSTGLYIHARDSSIVKVSIPQDCLAFQTGEALQIITGGKLRAVPHFVRAGKCGKGGVKVSRNTLAVFTQPDLEEIVDRQKGVTFGAFSREVMSRVSCYPSDRTIEKNADSRDYCSLDDLDTRSLNFEK